MNLSERLNEDMKQAMKSKDKFTLSTIRMVRSTIKYLEIDLKRTLDDNEVLDILSREIKQRKDASKNLNQRVATSLPRVRRQKSRLLLSIFPSNFPKKKLKQLYSRPSRKPVLLRKAKWVRS